MKVAIVDRNPKIRQSAMTMLKKTCPGHEYITYSGEAPWPELTDPTIEAMIVGWPAQSLKGVMPEYNEELQPTNNNHDWVDSGLDYLQAHRLGAHWWLSGAMKANQTIKVKAKTKAQFPILFINSGNLPKDYPAKKKFNKQFKETFFKTCGANTVIGYPFDESTIKIAFCEALAVNRLYVPTVDF
tara:strand:+ start:35 stop:589 length:555 start_codon:yes stop_codon:yes gene_type:complete